MPGIPSFKKKGWNPYTKEGNKTDEKILTNQNNKWSEDLLIVDSISFRQNIYV